jgi:aminodeoxyfutalosine synthase
LVPKSILDTLEPAYRKVSEKIIAGKRLSEADGELLFNSSNIALLGILATIIRKRINGDSVWFNRNFHIEPTNICIYNCKFCSYKKPAGSPGSWVHSPEDILNIVRSFDQKPVTEVHIVGGVHPSHDLHYYGNILRMIKEHRPELHIKAFSAIELDYMIAKAGMSLEEGLKALKEYGLDSIPGGGAEIFDEKIRSQICDDKSSSEFWLKIHKTAHKCGIPSNATILYGHIENYSHRIDHLSRLRALQDETRGFNTFIPLKYRKANNSMTGIGETSIIEDMKNFAVSRLFLDNIPHLKAYWPALGRESTQLSLSFGVDDIDGTIDDTTKIYSMAGAEDQNPSMSTDDLVKLVKDAGYIPVERDTLYNTVREW